MQGNAVSDKEGIYEIVNDNVRVKLWLPYGAEIQTRSDRRLVSSPAPQRIPSGRALSESQTLNTKSWTLQP